MSKVTVTNKDSSEMLHSHTKALKQNLWMKLAVAVVTATCVYFIIVYIYNWYPSKYNEPSIVKLSGHGDSVNIGHISTSSPVDCNATFGQSEDDDKLKIMSYKFPDAIPYLKNFKCLATRLEKVNNTCHGDKDNIDILPTIVTAASSNHFRESMSMVHILNEGIRKQYTGIKLVYFDIGLTEKEKGQARESCKPNCDFQQFPFDKFPPHVKILKVYAWKPIAIQLVLDKTNFVIWADSSIDFQTINLTVLSEKAKSSGMLLGIDTGYESIAAHTGKFLFNFLGEEPCLFAKTRELTGGFSVIYWNTATSKYLMEPWLSCALSLNCMVPAKNPLSYLSCRKHKNMKYHRCHRFDQSVLGILTARLYHNNDQVPRQKPGLSISLPGIEIAIKQGRILKGF